MTPEEGVARSGADLDTELTELCDRNVFLLLTPFDTAQTLERIGYTIDKRGSIRWSRNNKEVEAEDTKTLNVYSDKHFALISGSSHIFVRNIAGFSQYLAQHNLLKFKEG